MHHTTHNEYLAAMGQHQRQERQAAEARAQADRIADLSVAQLRTMLSYLKNIKGGTFRVLADITEDLRS